MRIHSALCTLLFLFLLVPRLSAADDYATQWKAVEAHLEKQRPKSALEIVQKIYTQAKKERNEQQIIKSTLTKLRLQADGVENSELILYQEITKEIPTAATPLVRSMLQYALGELYWNYYNQNRWKFSRRSQTKDANSKDFSAWDPKALRDTARSYYLAALSDEKALQSANVSNYELLLESNKESAHYRPTFYDILTHKTIEFLQQSQAMSAEATPEVNDKEILASLPSFISATTLTTSTPAKNALAIGNNNYLILSLYQKILTFHQKDKEPTALIDADILRLQFARTVSANEDKDSLFMNALISRMNVHSADSSMTLIAFAIAQELVNQDKPDEAMQYCERAIKQFPNSHGAKNCEALKAQILRKELSVAVEKTLQPDAPFLSTVTSKNVQKLYFKIVKTDHKSDLFKKIRSYDDGELPKDKLKKLLALTTVQSWEMTLPKSTDFRSHTVDIRSPALPLGQYFLLVSPQEKFTLDSNAVAYTPLLVTRLSLQSQIQPNDGTMFFMVNDAETGKPLEGVTAKIYSSDFDYTTRKQREDLLTTKKTNGNGEFVVTPSESNNKNFRVELTKGENYFATDNNFYTFERAPEQDHNRTLFFTDRQIYRPGQTIYFKGIIFKNNNEQAINEVLKNEKTTVRFHDATYKEVTKLELRTNEFGSFSGSFTAPSTGLTGMMNIRNETGNIVVRVEEYKRPKFEVKFNPTKGAIVLGEKVTTTGNVLSFAGANISGATVTYRVTRSARFPYPMWDNFPPRYSNQQKEISHGATTTNALGEFTVEFPALPDKSIPKNDKPVFTYTVSADVTDINGETHSSQTVVSAGYISLELGLVIGNDDEQRMMYEDGYNQNNHSGNEPFVRNFKQNIRITSKNINQTPLPAWGTLKIERLEQPNRSGILRDRLLPQPDQFLMTKDDFIAAFPNESYHDDILPEKWTVAQVIDSKEIQTDSSGLLTTGIDRLLAPGMYRITLQSKDISGAALEVVRHCVVYDSAAKTPALRLPVTLIPQNVTCEPGEKATFLFGTSYPSATVRYQVEYRNQMLDEKLLEFSNEVREFSLPIEEKHRGGFTIHLTMVHDGRMYARSVHIAVPWSNKDLTIETATFRDKLQPGAKERWRLTIKNKDGKAPSAEMVARLYDASLDAITPSKWEEFGWMNMYSNVQTSNHSFAELYANVEQVNWNPIPIFLSKNYSRLLLNLYNANQSRYYGASGVIDIKGKDQIGTVRSSSGEEMNKVARESVQQVVALKAGIQTDEGGFQIRGSRATDSQINVDGLDVGDQFSGGFNKKTLIEDLTTVKARTNFNETAFFYPQLLTDSSGAVILDFTIPEALTRWKMTAFAHTPDLQTGSIERTVVTQKDLMLEPNMPRFMRVGDTMTLPVKITNLTKNVLKGAVELTLFDAFTMKPVSAEFGLGSSTRLDFSAPASNATTVQWRVIIPENYQAIVYRVAAKSGDFSDGEEAPIPILPNRMLVTESIPMWVSNVAGGASASKKFTMEKLKQSASSPTLKHHKLTLEMTSNPAWYAIQALPSLMEFPHECAEQIFNRFYANALAGQLVTSKPRIKQVFDAWKSSPDALSSNFEKNQELKSLLLEETPWVLQGQNETERKKRVALFFDLNRMSNEQSIALNKLSKMQLPNGAFAWFSGMSESSFITNYILAGFGHLNVLGVKFDNPTVKKITSQALFFSDKSMNEDYERLKAIKDFSKKGDYLGSTAIQYLYARSYFTETKMSNQYDEAFDFWKEQAKAHWQKRGLMEQAMIALALKRLDIKGTPEDIITSLNERSLTSDELGMYWKENKAGWLWQEAPIETQAILMEAFDEITGNSKAVELMKVWLLKQKQVQDWATTKATAEACYALLRRGADWLESTNLVNITVGGKTLDLKSDGASIEAGTGYFKTSWSGKEITPNMSDITLTKTDKGIAWGGLYWQYYEQLNRITPHASPLSLSRTIYRKNLTSNGVELAVISPNSPLKVGDEIVIKLELRTDRDMEFIHLKDMRGAGFEPTIQLSGYKYQDGLGYFQSPRDGSMNFFISSMSKGTYVLEYPLRVTHEGVFSAGISTLQSMYAPEFSSHSQGDVVRVGK
ncbi:MAG: alpha-2-macroglobulin family protein [Candidatus Kapaibacterium sp.]